MGQYKVKIKSPKYTPIEVTDKSRLMTKEERLIWMKKLAPSKYLRPWAEEVKQGSQENKA